MQVPVADILRAFGTLGELGRGQPPGHGWRATLTALAIADELRVGPDDRAATYSTTLLFHAGCTAGGSQFAALIAADELAAKKDRCMCDPANISDVFARVSEQAATGTPLPKAVGRVLPILGESSFLEFDRGCSDVGAHTARRLGLSVLAVASLKHVCETWSGTGTFRVRGASIPLPTRIAQAAMIAEVFTSDGGITRGRQAVLDRARTFLDPDVTRAYEAVSRNTSFERRLEATALADDPLRGSHIDLEDVVMAMADVVDLKSPTTTAHSRTVAALTEQVARAMGLPDNDLTLARQAAMVHDVGKVAVLRSILEKRIRNSLEDDQLRLHVAFGERILRSSKALAPLADVAMLHHERLDDSGYPAAVHELSPVARILAAVDAFVEERDLRTGPLSETNADALAAVRAMALDQSAIDILAAIVARTSGRRAPKGPADLSERELEVLVLVGRGLTNAEVAKELHVSAHTVRHHLEHIYEKIDVTSRAGATLFAAEHGYL